MERLKTTFKPAGYYMLVDNSHNNKKVIIDYTGYFVFNSHIDPKRPSRSDFVLYKNFYKKIKLAQKTPHDKSYKWKLLKIATEEEVYSIGN